jgi:polygalacturonase
MENRRTFALSALGLAGAGSLVRAATDFGTAGTGKTLDTVPLQKAIDAVHARGGGVVLVPPGVYLTGTLELKSNVTLHLSAGATLLGSRQLADYPEHVPAARSYTDNYTRRSMIWAEGQENIGLEGAGTIDGQGAFFSGPYLVRPYMIRVVGCRRVRVRDLTIRESPMWVQHYLLSDDVVIDGVTVRSQVNHNNDGIDIDSCRRVRISNCDINSEDDGIVLKSTTATPSSDVVITNCVVSSMCNAIKLGTESHGGFENIAISNCTIYDTHLTGVAVECVDGGKLERVTVTNIAMKAVQCPLFIRLGDRGRTFADGQERPGVGVLRDVTISNIVATGAGPVGCSVTGLPERPLENVVLSNIHLEALGGGTREQAGRAIAEEREHYPEHNMYGTLPAYGIFFRHARGLVVENLRLATHRSDLRHAVVFDDVEDLALRNLRARPAEGAAAVVRMTGVRGALLTECRAEAGRTTFLRVTGKGSDRIALAANDLGDGAGAVVVEEGLPQTVIRKL